MKFVFIPLLLNSSIMQFLGIVEKYLFIFLSSLNSFSIGLIYSYQIPYIGKFTIKHSKDLASHKSIN